LIAIWAVELNVRKWRVAEIREIRDDRLSRPPPSPTTQKMFSHIFIGISDFDRAFKFYSPIMTELNLQLKFRDDTRPWAGWVSVAAPRPLFLIGRPFDGNTASSGNGQMTAFLAANRGVVDRTHAIAMANGGVCEGPPGLRPEYHPHYYGAYFRDPDGNKICVCCHDPA
jgi:catechol 2,3-dioxygenase-like lactoylglutathione lyase family enzyme